MKNIKSKLISVIALVGLVGSPVLALAQSSSTSSVQTAKEAVEKEMQDLKNAREALKEARENAAKEHRSATSTKARKEESEKKREDVRKQVLLRLVDLQIKHFQNVEDRVARMPNIDDALKAQLKTEIDKQITALNDLKAKVNAATTMADLKALAQQIKASLKNKEAIVQKIVEAIIASHLKDIIAKAGDRIQKAEAKIAELKTAGKDVTELEKLLATAKDKLAAAQASLTKNAYKDAKEALNNLYEALKQFNEKESRE